MQSLFISSEKLFKLRSFFFIVTVECIILNLYLSFKVENVHSSYVYLTTWALFMTSAYFGLALLDQTYHLQRYDQFELIIENLFKVVINTQFLVSIFFWLFLSGILVKQYDENPLTVVLSIQTHSFMIVFLWIDNIFNLVKVKKNDYLYSYIFGSIYLVFNFMVVKSSGHYVYPQLKFQQAYELLTVLFSYWVIYVSHFVLKWFYTKYKKQKINKALFDDISRLEQMYINMNLENRLKNI